MIYPTKNFYYRYNNPSFFSRAAMLFGVRLRMLAIWYLFSGQSQTDRVAVCLFLRSKLAAFGMSLGDEFKSFITLQILANHIVPTFISTTDKIKVSFSSKILFTFIEMFKFVNIYWFAQIKRLC